MTLRQKLKKLQMGYEIVGVIDSYDKVSSVLVDEKTIDFTHDDFFPGNYLSRWQFCLEKGYPTASILSDPLDCDEFLLVKEHLIKAYGIKFWENGHYDIDEFRKIAEAQTK